MTHWIKLTIPLGLGLLASFFNYVTVSSKIRPVSFVRVSQPLQRGEAFVVDNLERISLSGDLADLPNTAVPWDRRGVLLNRPAPRNFQQGDIVFWRDGAPNSRELLAGANERFIGIPMNDMSIIPEFIRVGQQVDFVVGNDQDTYFGETASAPQRTAAQLKAATPDHSIRTVGPFRVVAVGTRVRPGGEISDSDHGTDILTVAVAVSKYGELEESAKIFLAARAGYGGDTILGIVLRN